MTLQNGNVAAARNGIFATNDAAGFGGTGPGNVGITITGGSIAAPTGIGAWAQQGGSGNVSVTMTGGQVSAAGGLQAQIESGGGGTRRFLQLAVP